MLLAIREMIDFVNAGQRPSFVATATALDNQALRVLTIKVLSWLKSRANLSKGRPLELRDEFTWCANLRLVFSCSEELARTFEIRDNRLDFAADVPAQDRDLIAQFVDQNFQPPLMT